MAEMDIDEGQARAQIQACEAELGALRAKGSDNLDAERSLKQARAFFKVGLFDKAYLSAVRGRRLCHAMKQA